MQAAGEGTQNGNRLRRAGRFVWQQLRDDWPAVIFVACVFSVLDNHFEWLRAVESYTFAAIGNAAVHAPGRADSPGPRALVLGIDQQALETRYHERSPLDRCELRRDLTDVLGAIRHHNATPGARPLNILVIDLDLQPWQWLETDAGRKSQEVQCEDELYTVLRSAHKDLIRIVLMTPLDVVPQRRQRRDQWMKDFEDAVSFGRADLQEDYGLTIKQEECRPDTLAGAAFVAWAQQQPGHARAKDECVANMSGGNADRKPKRVVVDPRQYRRGVVLLELAGEPGSSEREDLLRRTLAQRRGGTGATDGWQAVFFGAAYGADDLFVTPLGDRYGAEVHAAGFLSFIHPLREQGLKGYALFVDIVYGFLFGLVASRFWRSYYRRCLSASVLERLRAPLTLLQLLLAVAAMSAVLVVVSFLLLLYFGIWAAPVSMAVGMLFDGFVSGPAQHGENVTNELQGTARPERRSFGEGARKLFGGAIVHFWRRGEYDVATCLTARLLVWIGIVAWAIAAIATG